MERRSGPPVPAARRSLSEFAGTVCARWLKFLCSRDPSFKQDTLKLLREFGEREGFSLEELDVQFREEEAELARRAAEMRRLRLSR
jgi:hypothetical protein